MRDIINSDNNEVICIKVNLLLKKYKLRTQLQKYTHNHTSLKVLNSKMMQVETR